MNRGAFSRNFTHALKMLPQILGKGGKWLIMAAFVGFEGEFSWGHTKKDESE
jgi:hypothetical protein